jgi:hypothetical protein
VRLHDDLEELVEGIGIEVERDLLERLAGCSLRGGLAGIDLAARHVVDLAVARGDHEHAPFAHEGDRGDEEVGQVRHPFHPRRGMATPARCATSNERSRLRDGTRSRTRR